MTTYSKLFEELTAARIALTEAMTLVERSNEIFHREYVLENLELVDKSLTVLEKCMLNVPNNES